MTPTSCRLVGVSAVLAVALLIAAGCNTQEKVVAFKGKVTFKGQPVPAGWISFMPDSSKGGQGAVKVAQIKDGMYDTALAADGGILPGPTVIRIAGFDGKVIPRFAQGKQIFNIYELRDTLVDGMTTKDFTVPESAADNLKIEPTADQ
jgi:hypothetical protein